MSILAKFGRYESIGTHPVWAPDSKTILINRTRDEQGHVDIYALDVASGQLKKKINNTLPLYGWVRSK
jgi:Tol biopolymer transport system component